MIRGCGDEDEEEDRCEPDIEDIEDILNDQLDSTSLADLQGLVEINEISGSQCTCTVELCNNHTMENTMPG